MTRRFGTGASRLAGLSARMLGWRPDEFWRATPAELTAILAPAAPGGEPLSRNDLNRMMERNDG